MSSNLKTIATLLAEDETPDENELGEILHAIEKKCCS